MCGYLEGVPTGEPVIRREATEGAADPSGMEAAPALAAPVELLLSERSGRRLGALAGATRAVAVRRLLLAADVTAAAAASSLALVLGGSDRAGDQLPWALAFVPVMVLLFKLYGLYDRDDKRLSHSTLDDVPALAHAALIGTLALWGLFKVLGIERVVFAQAILLLALTVLLVCATRSSARAAIARLAPAERMLLVGAGPSAQLVLQKLREHPRYGVNAVGYLRAEPRSWSGPVSGLPCLGSIGDFAEVCGERGIHRVLIASAAVPDHVMSHLTREANKAGVKVGLLPSVVDVLGPSTEIDDVQGVTILGVNPVRLTRSSRLLKRALDVTVSSLALLSLAWLLPLVALAIKLDSRGPVFFKQDRMGRRGQRFRVYKLRTMVVDAEQRVEELRPRSDHAAWLLLDHDPRVTRVGRLLRLTSADELPQLWNVLRGEMSLVGPRPMPLDTDRQIDGWGRRRLDLKPGITGLWQVLGRTSISFEEMIKLDYLYVTNWSLWSDIRLLLRTVFVVLGRRGAN